MNKRNIKKLGAVLAVLLLACLVLAGAGAADTSTLKINVIDDNGNVDNANIVISGGGLSEPIKGLTDSNGYFTATLTSSTLYTIVITKDGYNDYQGNVIPDGNVKPIILTHSATFKSTVTVFYYQTGLNSILPVGYTYSDRLGSSFTVLNDSTWYLDETTAPAGTYYHFTDNDYNAFDQIVTVCAPALIMNDISNKTIYNEATPSVSTITVVNNAGVDFADNLFFVKEGESVMRSTIPGATTPAGTITTSDSTVTAVYTVDTGYIAGSAIGTAEKGNWDVYAKLDLSSKANDAAYLYVGNIKVQKDKNDGEASLINTELTGKDGSVMEVTLTGPKYSNSGDEGKVTVEFYESDKTSIDAIPMTTETTGLRFLENQANLSSDGTYFMIPNSRELTFGIEAVTNSVTDKIYNFEIYVTGCGDKNPGGTDNPLNGTITVEGYKFTAALDAQRYIKGTPFTVTGTYEKEDFQAYVYMEGTNTALFAPAYDTKYTTGGTIIADTEYKDGNYSLKFDGENLNNLNAGTYTVYVSPEKIDPTTIIIRGNEKDYPTAGNPQTKQYLTGDSDKTEMLKGAKVLTLILTEPMIEITDADTEIEAGISNYKGKYLTVDVSAQGASDISLYIIGQNKIYYINGDEAEAAGYLKNLNVNDTEHYLYSTTTDNRYSYRYTEASGSSVGTLHSIAEEKSVTKIAEKLGLNYSQANAYTGIISGWFGNGQNGEMPLYLILDNCDGTFTIYIHIQASGEVNAKDDAGNYMRGAYQCAEQFNNTEFATGTHYIIAQHPMADSVFNVWAGVIVPGDKVTAYATAVGISGAIIPTTYADKYYALYYDRYINTWTAIESPYTTQTNIFSSLAFEFNIPSFKNLDAATKLTNLISDRCDASDSVSFLVEAAEDAKKQVIKAPESSYEQGDIISIIVSGSKWTNVTGTFESTVFEFGTPSRNYISSFDVTYNEDTSGNKTYTLTLDTSDVPEGDYYIILREGTNQETKITYEVTINAREIPSDTLYLRAGWNFISVPMNLDSSMKEVSDYFEGVDMDERGVFGYDSSTKTWKQLSASTVLEPLEGYWVYSKTEFIGTKKILYDTNSMSIGATKNIYKGWNAVGLNIDVTQGKNTLSAKSTFAGLDWNRYFEKYTTGAWTVIVNGGSTSESEENYIYAGAGGWLYANEDGVLVGNSA